MAICQHLWSTNTVGSFVSPASGSTLEVLCNIYAENVMGNEILWRLLIYNVLILMFDITSVLKYTVASGLYANSFNI